MREFTCPVDSLKTKKCSGERICCYYCKHIAKCFKNWNQQPRRIYCKIIDNDKWCSGVNNFIKRNGGIKEIIKEKVIFT